MGLTGLNTWRVFLHVSWTCRGNRGPINRVHSLRSVQTTCLPRRLQARRPWPPRATLRPHRPLLARTRSLLHRLAGLTPPPVLLLSALPLCALIRTLPFDAPLHAHCLVVRGNSRLVTHLCGRRERLCDGISGTTTNNERRKVGRGGGE